MRPRKRPARPLLRLSVAYFFAISIDVPLNVVYNIVTETKKRRKTPLMHTD
nr:MAG TPA: hypothetical protein [Caudoviricetes sp.]